MKKRILVLGYFGYQNNQLDGQTIKTRNVYALIKQIYGEEVFYFDTQILSKRNNVWKMLSALLHCEKLVYLPASRNLKWIFPFLFLLSNIIRFDIIYVVIGGWIGTFLKSNPLHCFMLRHIWAILSETALMRKLLMEQFHFNNVALLSNFRISDYTPVLSTHNKFKLVFMARVNRLKGLDYIFNLAKYLTQQSVQPHITIDFYGPIYFEDREYFLTEVGKYPFISYKGELNPSEINKVLNQYDLMLFPTQYYTEGLPGTIIDAFMSGIPVIATEWLHAHEFIINGMTGYIIPFKGGQELFNQRIMYLYENMNVLMQMKKSAVETGKRFSHHIAGLVLKHAIDYGVDAKLSDYYDINYPPHQNSKRRFSESEVFKISERGLITDLVSFSAA